MSPTSPHPELPAPLLEALRGKFLVFDGPDGSGKSTQLSMFLGAVRNANMTVIDVREPGGTEIGEKIRDALLGHLDKETMNLDHLIQSHDRLPTLK